MTTTINASNSGSGGLIQTADASGVLALQTAGVTAVTVDTSQNVGIGTSSPTQKLDVYGGAGAAVSVVRAAAGQNAFFSVAGNGNSFLSTSFDIVQDSTNLAQIAQRANAAMAFSTNNTERMRIDSSGNVLVGTTSVSGGRVNVLAAGGATGIVVQVTTNGNYGLAFNNASGTNVGRIQIDSAATSYVTSSDYRLKENIAPMTGALAKVAALKPVTYNWKIDGSDAEGFIAHELAEVSPQCVSGAKDAVDANGNPVYQGIDTSFLVATLTAAIQEQQAIITSLTARIAALEGTQP